VIVLAALAVGAYSAVRFVPIYIEKSRVNRLVKQAANSWINVTPSLDQVKKELQANLEMAQVEHITAEDVNFVKVSPTEVEATVEYQVTVKHPYNIVKPTRLKFRVYHRATLAVTN
jgi:hypothetical protein